MVRDRVRILPFLAIFLLSGTIRLSAIDAVFSLVRTLPTEAPVKFGSPVLVDLDGNPRTLEIVVGDESGTIYAFDCCGSRLWSFSIRRFPGYEWVQTACQCAPTVADLDGDGALEVVVSLASRDEFVAEKPGAIFMFRLDPNGLNPTIAGGFARLTLDRNGDTIPEGAFASPAAADLDGDGQMEILATSWDELCYALRADGSQVWDLDYDLTDPNEFGFKTGDTVWTTPAVADVNYDGVPDVIFGSDAHDFPWGHQIPYQTHTGGILVELDGPTGHLEVGPGTFFIPSYHEEGSGYYYNPQGENHIPVCNISQVLQSSPVIADLDADGLFEIVHGTGQIVYYPSDEWHDAVFCWNGEDASLQWVTNVGSEVFACCALANVDDEPDLEVFVRNFSEANPMLYALKGSTGEILPGFPAPIKPGNPRSIGAVVGDVDGDGQMEIILLSYGRVHVFNTDGWEESHFDDAPNALFTSPAIGDIDSDGRCELVVGTSNGLSIYRCNGRVGAIPWGQYRRDPTHAGVVPLYDSAVASVEAPEWVAGGGEIEVTLRFYNTGSAVWLPDSVTLLNLNDAWWPRVIAFSPTTWVANGQSLLVSFPLHSPREPGRYVLEFQLRGPDARLFGAVARAEITVGENLTGVARWRLYR